MGFWNLLKYDTTKGTVKEKHDLYQKQKKDHQKEQAQIKKEGGYKVQGTWRRLKD